MVAAIVGAVFLADDPAEGIVLQGAFTDDNGSIFEQDIDAIAAAGITKGCDPPANTRFCPDGRVTRGQMAAFIRRALGLPSSGTNFFVDDGDSIFEQDIDAIAAAGITKGCNPPANTRFCPDDLVTRGQMAAFLDRALGLPDSNGDFFVDDDLSIFEANIDAIAAAGITKGCNPPANTRFCPDDDVTRGQMAAFLRRALGLPAVVQAIPLGDHPSMACSKDGESCSLTVDVSAGVTYRVEEGWFQVLPASASELAALSAGNTSFTLTRDGSPVGLTEQPLFDDAGLRFRNWQGTVAFGAGNHSLVGRWRWQGDLELTTVITIRAASG
jgi:hypothetical protein